MATIPTVETASHTNQYAEELRVFLESLSAGVAAAPGATDLPVYADNATALADEAAVGSYYRTATGVVMQVYAAA